MNQGLEERPPTWQSHAQTTETTSPEGYDLLCLFVRFFIQPFFLDPVLTDSYNKK